MFVLSTQRVVLLCAYLLFVHPVVFAQHQGHQMPTPSPKPNPSPVASPERKPPMVMPSASPAPPADTHRHSTSSASAGAKDASSEMMEMGPLLMMRGDEMFVRVGESSTNVTPMGRMGSGTSWQPASTSMYMIHKQSNDWLLMFHYNAFIGSNSQGGSRGVTKFESANWIMPSATRRVGPGTLELRGMFSFEPFTFPPGGSPLLFQTGETYKGQPLIDRQHPHDLFMELSASYTVPLGEKGTWFAYAGYPGEPALGPVAFMHRASASENSSAPLSHHLQDSTHISFGVVTTGFTYRWFKLEGSLFNGREPDEDRYDFEANPWTSKSVPLVCAQQKLVDAV